MPVRFAHFMDTLAFVEGNLNAQEIFEKKICGQLLPNTFHQRISSFWMTMRQFTGHNLPLNISSEIK